MPGRPATLHARASISILALAAALLLTGCTSSGSGTSTNAATDELTFAPDTTAASAPSTTGDVVPPPPVPSTGGDTPAAPSGTPGSVAPDTSPASPGTLAGKATSPPDQGSATSSSARELAAKSQTAMEACAAGTTTAEYTDCAASALATEDPSLKAPLSDGTVTVGSLGPTTYSIVVTTKDGSIFSVDKDRTGKVSRVCTPQSAAGCKGGTW